MHGSKNLTSQHSPLIYNRSGEPVGGGANVITRIMHCVACNKFWTAKQSELEEVQGKLPKWEIRDRA